MKYLIILFLGFHCLSTSAQFLMPSEIPANLKSTFDSVAPYAEFPVWKFINNAPGISDKYIVTFVDEDVRTWVVMNKSGNLIDVERELEVEELPAGIRSYVSTNHKFTNVTDGRIIFVANQIFYCVTATGKNINHHLLFAADGNLLEHRKDVFTKLISKSGTVFSGLSEKGFSNSFFAADYALLNHKYQFGRERQ
jgi:hypothetical protein